VLPPPPPPPTQPAHQLLTPPLPRLPLCPQAAADVCSIAAELQYLHAELDGAKDAAEAAQALLRQDRERMRRRVEAMTRERDLEVAACARARQEVRGPACCAPLPWDLLPCAWWAPGGGGGACPASHTAPCLQCEVHSCTVTRPP